MRDIYSTKKYKIKLINNYPYGKIEEKYVISALRGKRLAQGKYVQNFEQDIAQYLDHINPEFVIATSTGTAALHMAVELAFPCNNKWGGPNVSVPATTFTSTSDAIRYARDGPAFVDIDGETWNAEINHPFGIGVDLFGVPCNLGTTIIDACESLGATYQGRKCGTLAKYNCLSFFANKPITTGGEGGILVVSNQEDSEKARRMRTHGRLFGEEFHSWPAFGYRMTEMQAAFGIAQMKILNKVVKNKRDIHGNYLSELGESVKFQGYNTQSNPSWYFNCIKFKTSKIRAKIQRIMDKEGIECRRVFQPPRYNTPSWIQPCPNSEELYECGLIFPSGPVLSDKEIRKISKIILAKI